MKPNNLFLFDLVVSSDSKIFTDNDGIFIFDTVICRLLFVYDNKIYIKVSNSNYKPKFNTFTLNRKPKKISAISVGASLNLNSLILILL